MLNAERSTSEIQLLPFCPMVQKPTKATFGVGVLVITLQLQEKHVEENWHKVLQKTATQGSPLTPWFWDTVTGVTSPALQGLHCG